MNNSPSCSKTKQNNDFEDDEVFEDSTFMAQFDNSFKQTSKLSESNMNHSYNNESLNVSALCCDEELSGYDRQTGKTWIYPTNYPVRDYQFNIIRTALLKNTLVSLPTGLGKTFIAAVIMYNFYRWYPLGKIIFTAPTRPLVAQQIDACYKIIAIPPNDTIEMTGHMQVSTRKSHWQSKRVVFATPQVIYNDIKSGICPSEKIRCLVIDEAHRARGNYAYCQIVCTLDDLGHKLYRILALSATPGSKVEDVITLVRNLHIAHLELRTEDCIDVAPYSHARKISTVVIKLSQELNTLRQQYVEILDGYARRLKQLNILPNNLGNLSKGRVVMMYKEFQNKERGARHAQHNYIMKDFTLLIALFHGLELLVQHGSRVFLNFFDEHPEKSWIQSDDKLTALLERLRDDLGVNPLSLNRSILPDGSVPELPKNLCFGHPKFDKLREIMMNHFTDAQRNEKDTRAIVFCEYRESVNLVHCMLLQCRPLIKPQMFVGQGASGKDGKAAISQNQQVRVMRSFREGNCNVLVATCVAEEGLDVGSVDLILCFDISTRSPRRLVQRCGRTGRERGGQVFILVTEGREHQTLLDCMRQRDGLNKKILQSKDVDNNLYKSNPRMMPRDHTPQCQKLYVTVEKKPEAKDKNKDGVDKSNKGQKDLRSMLVKRSSVSLNRPADGNSLINVKQFRQLYPDGYKDTALLPEQKEYWTMNKDYIKDMKTQEDTQINFNKWLDLQKSLQKTGTIEHSKDTEILVELLQHADNKKKESQYCSQNRMLSSQESPRKVFNFNLLSPQKLSSTSPGKRKPFKKNKNIPSAKMNSQRDGDIRALFSVATKSTKDYTKLINGLGIQNDGSIPTRLVSLLVDLSLDKTTKQCYFCQNICDCSVIKRIKKHESNPPPFVVTSLKQLSLPDIDLIEDFNADIILSLADKSVNKIDEGEINELDEKLNLSNNFDLELDFLELNNLEQINESVPKKDNHIDSFDVGNIEDIFADSGPEEIIAGDAKDSAEPEHTKRVLSLFGQDGIKGTKTIEQKKTDDIMSDDDFGKHGVKYVKDDKSKEANDILSFFGQDSVKHVETTEKPKATNDILSFFGLDSVEDIFADDIIEGTPPESNISLSKITQDANTPKTPKESLIERAPSPSILSGRPNIKELESSPILCSQYRQMPSNHSNIGTRSSTPASYRKQLVMESSNNSLPFVNDKRNKSMSRKSLDESKNKSMFSITQLVDMINRGDGNESLHKQSNASTSNESQNKKDNRGKDSSILASVTSRNSSPILLPKAKRSMSPILLSQSNKSKNKLNNSTQVLTSQIKETASLVILDSDSDTDGTETYNIEEEMFKNTMNLNFSETSPPIEACNKTGGHSNTPSKNYLQKINCKRKLEDDSLTVSHFFCKKQKLDLNVKKKDSTSDNNEKRFKNDSNTLHCIITPRKSLSLKENEDPQILRDLDEKFENNIKKNNLDILQMFRRDSQIAKNDIAKILKSQPIMSQIPKCTSDSEDDFEEKSHTRNRPVINGDECRSSIKYKIRKKKKPNNSLLDLEAVLSDDGNASGDELSDDSVGSIAEFICDDSVIPQDDIHAVYLKSIKSPIKAGAFKIPQLPKKYDREEILSQHVEEDAYEMNSFCVDSHIGLTQVNEVSELELAEIVLEQKRRSKKKSRRLDIQDESPDAKLKCKPKKRQILSDSESGSE